jgi:phosphoribosyl-AMP cyclohydrolase
MSKEFFLNNEKKEEQFSVELSLFLQELNFDSQGLIPAIAQQYDTKQVLMMAWMNLESIQKTLESKQVCYWSRSRKKFWYKGEESGNIQYLKEMAVDCDGDAILLSVDQIGAACHTERAHCFYWKVDGDHCKLETKSCK